MCPAGLPLPFPELKTESCSPPLHLSQPRLPRPSAAGGVAPLLRHLTRKTAERAGPALGDVDKDGTQGPTPGERHARVSRVPFSAGDSAGTMLCAMPPNVTGRAQL